MDTLQEPITTHQFKPIRILYLHAKTFATPYYSKRINYLKIVSYFRCEIELAGESSMAIEQL
jgi:hypothetical protein